MVVQGTVLCPTRGEPKSQKDFVKNQDDALAGADLAQLQQPLACRFAIESNLSATVEQCRVGRCGAIGVHGLDRIDEHTGDVVAPLEYPQGGRMAFAQREGVRCRGHRIAGARLHVVPPAVIGTGKTNNLAPARVVPGEAHRLHHGLGTRHVERHFVLARDRAESLHVVEHAGVVGPQHHAEISADVGAAIHALPVEGLAKDVDPVGAGDIEERVAIEVDQLRAFARLEKAADLHLAGEDFAELERHPVTADELHVGDQRTCLAGEVKRLGRARGERLAQTSKSRLALGCNGLGSLVKVVEPSFWMTVAGQPAGEATGPTQVPAKPGVLGKRKLESLANAAPQHKREGGAGKGKGEGCNDGDRRIGHGEEPPEDHPLYDTRMKD